MLLLKLGCEVHFVKGDDSIHVCVDIRTLAIGASTRFRIVIDGSAIAS